MKIYTFKKVQAIPVSMAAAWDFLSDPRNLTKITPAYMGFKIISNENSDKMYPGQIISYTVKPLAGIPIKWVTEISHVQESAYFVDEQRFGPYKFWQHQHHLREIKGGTEMVDLIHYALPLGKIGEIANSILVKKQLETIFEYRRNSLEKLFGKMQSAFC
jgi:ligand-binding SRPBCC domain-containing protein